jgi:DNA-binding NarL/FixJ family response regulator
MEVVGEAETGRTVVQAIRQSPVELVIMDIGMPDLNGVEATRQIRQIAPGVKVIALSMHSDRRFISQMFKAGASAYLLKDCAFDELASAIQVVMSGRTYISPQIAGSVIKDYIGNMRTEESSAFSILTAREREVLQLLGEGRTVKQIALHLNLSVKTVETHRQQIMSKLDLKNVADLVKYSIREGFTSLEPSRKEPGQSS